MPSPFEAVSTYFYAKDGNRPFLMRRALQLEHLPSAACHRHWFLTAPAVAVIAP